jgi:ectoine hydroxylase-related dioxygenase (phytanoyl-CoA dioxygenase family)
MEHSLIEQDSILVSAEKRRQFETEGYFITDVVFDEEVLAPVRAEFERFWQERIDSMELENAHAQEQARYRPFLAGLHVNSNICFDFCSHPVFLQLCRELLGPDADLTWNQAIIKPPAPIDNAFSWHQDMWYALKNTYHEDCNLEILEAPDTGFTAWVAITRTIVDNGTLWVLPGMHQDGLLPHIRHEVRGDWDGQYDTSWKIPVVMRAGQVLVFNKYLPHSSGPNVSEETRMAYQIGYTIPGLKLSPSPDMTPVLRDGSPVI